MNDSLNPGTGVASLLDVLGRRTFCGKCGVLVWRVHLSDSEPVPDVDALLDTNFVDHDLACGVGPASEINAKCNRENCKPCGILPQRYLVRESRCRYCMNLTSRPRKFATKVRVDVKAGDHGQIAVADLHYCPPMRDARRRSLERWRAVNRGLAMGAVPFVLFASPRVREAAFAFATYLWQLALVLFRGTP